MTKGQLEIHTENIFPIIKKWLYSDKDIFIRELVSNACDAIYKVKILRDRGELQATDDEFRIEIHINKEARTLTFIDTGIGMDAEEVKKYIAQIAFSSAEEFMDKYKSNNEKDQIIGHFGLGFYSAYMVAEKVEINTLSWKPGAEPAYWSCDGSQEYTLDKGTKTSRGTEVILHIDKDNDEFLDQYHVKKILEHYCSFLPYPIYLGTEQVNTKLPLWIKSPADCSDEDYLEFYRHIYPFEEDPLFWVHLNVDYPFHLKGILYFPKIRKNFDINKSSVKLYCNRVFVSDNCKDILPSYLMMMRGIIDSPDIPLNVSRSYLQMDKTVRQLSSHISKKVTDTLGGLYRNDREKFIKSWADISLITKLGILEDDKFYERAKEFLIWKTVEGEWLTAKDYLERYKDLTNDIIFYTPDEKILSQFVDIYRKKGINILVADHPLDTHLLHYLERNMTPSKFQRIDAKVEEHLLDKDKEHTVLDESGRTHAAKLADLVKEKLGMENISVEAKSLASDSLPAFLMMDENERRMRDYMLSLDPEGKMQKGLMGKATLVVNTNNSLINSIEKLDKIDSNLSKDLVHQLYDLARLSQKEMDAESLNEFIVRTGQVIEKLAEQAIDKNKA